MHCCVSCGSDVLLACDLSAIDLATCVRLARYTYDLLTTGPFSLRLSCDLAAIVVLVKQTGDVCR